MILWRSGTQLGKAFVGVINGNFVPFTRDIDARRPDRKPGHRSRVDDGDVEGVAGEEH